MFLSDKLWRRFLLVAMCIFNALVVWVALTLLAPVPALALFGIYTCLGYVVASYLRKTRRLSLAQLVVTAFWLGYLLALVFVFFTDIKPHMRFRYFITTRPLPLL